MGKTEKCTLKQYFVTLYITYITLYNPEPIRTTSDFAPALSKEFLDIQSFG